MLQIFLNYVKIQSQKTAITFANKIYYVCSKTFNRLSYLLQQDEVQTPFVYVRHYLQFMV